MRSRNRIVTKQTKTWTKPTLSRLGQISTVAGTQSGSCQSPNGGGKCNAQDGPGFSWSA